MRSMRQPTHYTLEKATELGKLMAITEARLGVCLTDAHEYPGYVEFLQAHRHRLKQHAAFARWDYRLNALIESEGRLLGFDLTDPDQSEEWAIAIDGPIRCTFWYGWETVLNLKKKYDQHLAEARAKDQPLRILRARDVVKSPTITRHAVTATDTDEAFWDTVANNMLSSIASESGRASSVPDPVSPVTRKP